ncbi:TPA: hypothetical protein DEW47_01650 [Patescibacteria group bacterium]|nr:MAG: hypothetical protein UT71_C0009G0005 [Parcubacteria group bacterium GW2011_GWF2_40_10]KKR47436.1 MAG: hypothetical protein UT83_C0009G0002 [Parcubacteria group bacterium GW2011_GWA2_40_143]KKR59857.1 MAG: hypothetical protein UT97_C0009G0002 [Parcubacteria group bacterium GW2011_GWC2_40_31]KKR74928.1 MAG: hypothetical protein UU18_C0016G0004 [Parcubacteria group bacterium GW2011_GWB2_40_8]KKR76334.1 MAG: hypothetical protein UU20_C0027G0006 [Parcubacteria group bacterium GW2011_GWE2_40_
MQKIIRFIKYNNSFIIILGLVFLGAGSSFASEKVRDTVIGQTIEETKGMDNSALLATNLNSLKQEMSISDVSEDEDNYLISYSFSTFDIKDNIWQNQTKTQILKVPKDALNGGKDLGLYVQSELAQVMDTQLAYLKNAQEREQKKGETKITKTTKYTGLKGLVLNSETKELEGYEPVVKKEERVESAYVAPPVTTAINQNPPVQIPQAPQSPSQPEQETTPLDEPASESEPAEEQVIESAEEPVIEESTEEQTAEEPATEPEVPETTQEPAPEEQSADSADTSSPEEPVEEQVIETTDVPPLGD